MPSCRLPLLHLALAALAGLAGCAGGGAPAPAPGSPLVALPAAEVTSSSLPQAEGALRAFQAGSYEQASLTFEELSRWEPDAARRAELLFLAAEAALGAGEHYRAYTLYDRLLRRYPTTPRLPLAVERIFLIGRLYCEGVAVKPSWLLGASLSDREFGIQVLEAFQKSREQHPLADDALYYVGVGQEGLAEYQLAIQAWEKLVRTYPRRTEWHDSAEFRAAVAFLALSDGVDYDQSPLLVALTRLRTYAQRYPTGNHRAEALARISSLEEDLARHELELVRFYLRRDKGYSADIYLTAIQREYPRTQAADEARRLQGSLPKTSPPPPPPPPDEEDLGRRFRRLITPTGPNLTPPVD